LTVDFFQLYIDIMQKPLNTQRFAPYPLLQRILIIAKTRLSAGLALFLLVGFAQQALAASINPPATATFTPGVGTARGTAQNYSSAGVPASGFVGTINASSTAAKFDRGTGHLYLSGSISTSESGNENFTSVGMSYRVYKTGTTPTGNFNFLGLGTTDAPKAKDKVWNQPSSVVDLLSSTSEGDYTVQFYFQATYTSSTTGPGGITQRIGNSPDFYTAQFSVTGTAPTRWVFSDTSDGNWFTGSNWVGGVAPGPSTDVTIPATNDFNAIYPTIGLTSSETAYARTLTIESGNSTNPRSGSLTHLAGDLLIYGDFVDASNGLRESGPVTFALAGTNPQNFDGGIFINVRILGGSEKRLSAGRTMTISGLLEFLNGKIVTPTNSLTSGIVNLGSVGRITGETENNYIQGIVQASGRAAIGSPFSFGNIGVDLTLNSNSAATNSIVATRRTGLAYAGVGISTQSASITRSFTFSLGDTGQSFGLTFHYLDRELNGNTENKLGLYSYTVADGTSMSFGSDYTNVGSNTVTVNNITGRLATTFTLGEYNVTPLPVTLVSFTATPTPQGAALLRWVTAKELDNKGFGIERTLDPTGTWKEVGYVATTNTPNGKSYEYTDKSLITTAASTNAYYRLRQEDLDGKVSYSPVAAVARPSVVASSNLVLSPVPVDGPNLSVSFAEAGQAGQEVVIINTQGQRMLHFTTQENAEGTLSLPVANLAAGVYIVRIQTPGQAVRHARFVKL
jgi:hypothetical protein